MKETIFSFFSFISDCIWDLMPQSPFGYIIYLGIITIISIFLIFYFSMKKTKKNSSVESKKEITISHLLQIAKNINSTSKDLASALIMFSENFNIRGNEKESFELFKKILMHKNRDKNIFKIYQEKIVNKFNEYEKQLNKIEKDALNK